jgi:hypothetical protein
MKAKKRIALKLGSEQLYQLAWDKCYLNLPKWKKKEVDGGYDRTTSELAKEVIQMAEKQGFISELINED